MTLEYIAVNRHGKLWSKPRPVLAVVGSYLLDEVFGSTEPFYVTIT